MSTLSTLKYISFSFPKKHRLFYHPFPCWLTIYRWHSYIFLTNPRKSLTFHCLTYCQVKYMVVTFLLKQSLIMDSHTILIGIIPERLYSVSEAARYLGIHRCTIYTYINHAEKPLPFVRKQGNMRISFQGSDLITYKAAGLPKKGRKRKSNHP